LARYKADQVANGTRVEVLREGKFVAMESREISTGDVVRVSKDEQFPADMVLLSVSGGAPLCYVETSNLDGESNLKRVYSIKSTADMGTPDSLTANLKVKAVVERPNDRLYKFNGRLSHVGGRVDDVAKGTAAVGGAGTPQEGGGNDDFETIHAENVCLRGTRLKRTEHVHGLVVYTGMSTKLQMNMRPALPKFSQIDRALNRFIIGVFAVMMCCCIILTIGSMAVAPGQQGTWYLENARRSVESELLSFFTFFILLSPFLPLALMVNLPFFHHRSSPISHLPSPISHLPSPLDPTMQDVAAMHDTHASIAPSLLVSFHKGRCPGQIAPWATPHSGPRTPHLPTLASTPPPNPCPHRLTL
jgi:phospholipid-transporting ATPase